MTIYCVIAKDPQSGDEWVMPKTTETILEAGENLYLYKGADPRFSYRIEEINPTVTQVRTEDFAQDELFGPKSYLPDLAYGSYFCSECGSLVRSLEVHTAWHNKLLP